MADNTTQYDSEGQPVDNSPLAQGLAAPQGQAQAQAPAPAPNELQQIGVQQNPNELQQIGAQAPSAPQAPDPVQDPAPDPAPLPRFQRTIGNTAKGLLLGLLEGGALGAVAGAINPQGAQRAANQEQQLAQSQVAQAQANVKIANAQAAGMLADTTLRMTQINGLKQEQQEQAFKNGREGNDYMHSLGLLENYVTSNDAHSEMAAMQQATAQGGGVPPAVSFPIGPGVIAHYDLTQMDPKAQLKAVNDFKTSMAQPTIPDNLWAQLSPTARMQQSADALNYWQQPASQASINQYQLDLNRIKALPAGAVPDKEGQIAKLQDALKRSQDTLDAAHAHGLNQDANDIKVKGKAEAAVAGQKAYAAGYGATAGALKASQAAAKDANGNWNPTSEPVSLVEGYMDPTQLSKRSKTYDATLQQANQYSMERYGHPFDLPQAQMDFHYAQNPQTQNTLRMINGMTEPKGAISIAQQAAQSLPQLSNQTLNKVFNGAATEFGSSQETNFHTAMLGLADEYSKVMGSGASSDTGRQQALDILKSAYSKGQLTGAIQTIQSDLTARKTALVGTNRYLLKQYGGGSQAAQQQAGSVPQGAIGKIKGSDGNLYWTSDGKTGNLGRAQ